MKIYPNNSPTDTGKAIFNFFNINAEEGENVFDKDGDLVVKDSNLPPGQYHTKVFHDMESTWNKPSESTLIRKSPSSLDSIRSLSKKSIYHRNGASEKETQQLRTIMQQYNLNSDQKKWRISRCRLSKTDCEAIAHGIMTGIYNVNCLHLTKCKISDEGSAYISEAVRTNAGLENLFLTKNKIHNKGAIAFGEALKKNTMLVCLNLDSNSIGNAGARSIGISLQSNCTLKELSLNFNSLLYDGVQAIAESLKKNSTLQILSLTETGICCEGAKAFAEALKVNSCLQKLFLNHNRIKDIGAGDLASALNKNKTLNFLSLSKNQLSYDLMLKLLTKTKDFLKLIF